MCDYKYSKRVEGVEHTVINVAREMVLQIAANYPGIPDVRELTVRQIKFFYDGMRRQIEDTGKDG